MMKERQERDKKSAHAGLSDECLLFDGALLSVVFVFVESLGECLIPLPLIFEDD